MITYHARQRMQEMGVSPLVVLEILQHPDTTYPGTKPNSWVALSKKHPEYRVVFDRGPDGRPSAIITVAFENKDFEYVRKGTTFVPKEEVHDA